MTPNTRKPTKKQVPDTKECWYWEWSSWKISDGAYVRRHWCDANKEAWLPRHAIPDPNNTNETTNN